MPRFSGAAVGIGWAASGGRDPGDIDVVLHRHRHAGQRETLPTGQPTAGVRFHCPGGAPAGGPGRPQRPKPSNCHPPGKKEDIVAARPYLPVRGRMPFPAGKRGGEAVAAAT
jgi:hypothetical protein